MRKSLHILMFALLVMTTTVVMAGGENGGSAAAGVVNINTAGAAELALLPRVGEKAAQRIIEYRQQHGPFKKTADLMQVKGFGAKTYELVSPYITVSGATTLSSKVKSPRKPRAKKPASTASN